jgi:hypothetical protein
MMTGWPPGLLQDDCSGLSRWFASRPDARYLVRQQTTEPKMKIPPQVNADDWLPESEPDTGTKDWLPESEPDTL